MALRDTLTRLFAAAPIAPPLAAPPQGEIALAQRSFFARLPFEDYDPDYLKYRKGADVYEKMLRDPQVKAVFNLKRDLLVSRAWTFDRPDDTLKQRRIQEFFEFNINRVLQGAWLDALRGILLSWANGYSVSEKVYKPVVWERLDKWAIHAIKPRPYWTFHFKRDAYGNVTELIQEAGAQRLLLDPRKFIIHLANAELDPIFGVSDLQAAYRAWWEKDNITKFHDIYLERFATGFLWVTQKKPLDATARTDLQDILKNLSMTTAIMGPEGSEASVVHGPATDAYERAIIQRNQEIAKALGVPSLLGLSEQGRVGSFAQAKIQVDMFFLQLEREGQGLAEALNEGLFGDLARWNFGTEEYPRFGFDPFTEESKRAFVKAWVEAVAGGVVTQTDEDEAKVRTLLGFDARTGSKRMPNVVPQRAPRPPA